MEIKRVFIMGAGVMGSGIAQLTAQANYEVTLMDISQEFIERAIRSIDKSLRKRASKGNITEDDMQRILSHITTTTDIGYAREADLVVEAVPEIIDLKVKAFKELDKTCPERTIFASNTSTLPISALAFATKRPSRIIGVHFMNPVTIIKGVEIIPGRYTSEETLEISKTFVKSLSREPCYAVDYAGFIVSRIVDAMMNEAIYCIMDGNKPEEVDKAMRICCNFPMGPLELCDLAGADIVYHGLETMHKEFGDRLRPAPLLAAMVRAGELGRKSGHGFYDYKEKIL